ncbi:MAG: cupin domain-containing protein [Thermoleophilia bacterium]
MPTFADLPVSEPYEGSTRRAIEGEKATVIRYTLDEGHAFPLHRHPEEQITLVEAGELDFTLGTETRRVQAGDYVVVPPDVEHCARSLRGTASLLCVVAPARRDVGAVPVG